ncbi:acyl-CoA reductase [Portibacter marinus]|uniref:acyl-CoA reductase n=1 Tax=Portibacter marinus TaxID=2898660 RepID=UPI001F3F6F15|nr:acyl-CoA reductase [Portibacter marinus]
MSIEKRISELVRLGDYLRSGSEELDEVKLKAKANNAWFTMENINFALDSIANTMLRRDILEQWVQRYEFGQISKKIGLILAGNIPLVGFHDLMCCYVSGHQALVKTSSKDSILTTHLIDRLNQKNEFQILERLEGMEAIIATGSNQSAKQFERYFAKYPKIIRRNRNAIAILDGPLRKEEMQALGRDVFTYFGLGCRNVSKLYLSSSVNKVDLMEQLHEDYNYLIHHNKYKNNFDYNHAIYLLNGDDFMSSGAIIMRRHEDIVSRIACIHYEEFDDLASLEKDIMTRLGEIQCISGNVNMENIKILPLGACQQPAIDDYADGVDTLHFLAELSRS